MQKRTYNNVLKLTKLIMQKGYTMPEANEIAIQIFDNMDSLKMAGYAPQSAEFYASKIINK